MLLIQFLFHTYGSDRVAKAVREKGKIENRLT